jgi:cobalamin-dependent methionine synthase I
MIAPSDKIALDSFRRAGRIAAECREWASQNIKAGVEIQHVLETIEDMIRERYRGVRPAPGYPACPDHTEKRSLFALLGAERIGMAATQHVDMKSVNRNIVFECHH